MATSNFVGCNIESVLAPQVPGPAAAPNADPARAPLSQGLSKKERRDLISSFCEKLRDSTMRNVPADVAAEYNDLKEPGFEVFPQLLDVDFYRGETARDNIEYNAESNFTSNSGRWSGRTVNMKDVFVSKKTSKRLRHVTIVGGAGFGKTTLLKRFARMVSSGEIRLKKQKKYNQWFRSEEQLVHFINVRDLPAGDDEYTPCELLFRILVKEINEVEAKLAYEKLINGKLDILFVVDGLDQHSWVLERETKCIGYHEKGTVSAIFFSLLCGDLFPKARVLSSSREHKICFFEKHLRADRVIAMNGLLRSDIQRLAESLPRENGIEVWRRLSRLCPNLAVMCSTPLFLIFTIIVFVTKEDFASDTMSGLMTEFIDCFLHSKHMADTNREDVRSILSKLKKLSYLGTIAQRVIFKKEHLDQVQLERNQADDFVIFAPKRTFILVKEDFGEDDFVTFFCHQSVQETLTALYISEMSLDDFKAFIAEHLHKPHYSVVRRLVCGIVLNDQTNENLPETVICDLVDKRRFLADSMEAELQRGLAPRSFLELLMALYEAGRTIDNMLEGHVKNISVSREPLTMSEANVLGSVMGRSGCINSLELWDCRMDAEKNALIHSGVKDHEVRIKKIDMHSNFENDFDGEILGNIVSHCKVEHLNLDDCNMTDAKMEKCAKSFYRAKLQSLIIGKTANLGESGLRIIGEMVRTNQIRDLNLNKTDLTPKKLKSLRRGVDESEHQIVKLDINYNRNMKEEGTAIIADLANTRDIKEINMSRCNLSSGQLKSFGKTLRDAKLDILDITTHRLRRVTLDKDVDALLLIIPHVTKELRMLDWRIQPHHKEQLQKKLNSLNDTNLKIIYEHIGSEVLTRTNAGANE